MSALRWSLIARGAGALEGVTEIARYVQASLLELHADAAALAAASTSPAGIM